MVPVKEISDRLIGSLESTRKFLTMNLEFAIVYNERRESWSYGAS